MKLEALKEQARRHEQREEWRKALDTYLRVIQEQQDDEQPDLTLHNRVGDLQTRLKQAEAAVQNYERAIELYLEAELPNNAIAICKKVLRNLPDRSIFFLRMGQIRGTQGFLTDAKENFLTYAERMTAAGNLDAALDALVELVGLVPDDVEIRLGLADQLESRERAPEAILHYTEAYRQLVLSGQDGEADGVAERLREADPKIVLPDRDSIRAGAGALEPEPPPGQELVAGELELGSGIPGPEPDSDAVLQLPGLPGGERDTDSWTGEAPEPSLPPAVPPAGEEATPVEEPGLEGEGEELVAPPPAAGPRGGEWEDVPPSFGLDEGELAEALPAFDHGEEEEVPGVVPAAESLGAEEEPEPLPLLGDEDLEEPSFPQQLEAAAEDAAFEAALEEPEGRLPEEPEAPPSDSHSLAAEQGDLDLALSLVRAEIEADPDQLELYQRQVEYAFRKGETGSLALAYLDLAKCLLRSGSPTKARAIFQQVLSLDPVNAEAMSGLQALGGAPASGPPAEVASSEEYVDLGSMILGEEAEKTTRWQVTADTPSGDDQADFAKMLSQFKAKVSEHVDADDVSAHRDLGTAYLEMGLLDEAIGEFQMALRADPDHLPTHELMGRCWMEKGRPDMAVRALRRALGARFEVEDELIGIYYTMGRAQEELGNTTEAVEFYEKVFSLDINFEDVTERLRSLR